MKRNKTAGRAWLIGTLSFLIGLVIGTTPGWSAESAVGRSTGIGFIAGDPTGLSLQLNGQTANPINLGLAYSFDHWMQFWADYTFRRAALIDTGNGNSIAGYVGIGGGVIFTESRYYRDSLGVLARVPFGLEYRMTEAPLGFMLEIVPAFRIAPGTGVEVQGGIGVRYYF